MEYRCRIHQEVLAYAYEASRKRMEYHPEHAEECKRIIDELPCYKTMEEAIQVANELDNAKIDTLPCQIWSKVEKVDNVYRIKNEWYVIYGKNKMVAEYIGLVLHTGWRRR